LQECESISLTICGYSVPACEDITAADQCRRFATRTDSEVYAGTIDDVLDNDERWDVTYDIEITTIRNVENVDGSCVDSIGGSTRDWRFEKDVEHQVYNEETEEYEFQYWYNHVFETNSVSTNGTDCTGTYSTTEVSDDPAHNGTSGVLEDGAPDCTQADHDVALTECDWTRTGETFTKSEAWVPSLFGVDGTGTLVSTAVFSDEIIVPDVLAAMVFPDDVNGDFCSALNDCDTGRIARFRWVIPDTWPGSYFKITWDIVTYPTDPEAEPSYVQDLTWTWPGPGDPEDEDSWKSEWYEIEPPGEPGERKIVNIRFECYKSAKFGVKPQVTGEAVELPDP